jgi:hypothetical protein
MIFAAKWCDVTGCQILWSFKISAKFKRPAMAMHYYAACVKDTGLTPAEVSDMTAAWSANMEAVQKSVIEKGASKFLQHLTEPSFFFPDGLNTPSCIICAVEL